MLQPYLILIPLMFFAPGAVVLFPRRREFGASEYFIAMVSISAAILIASIGVEYIISHELHLKFSIYYMLIIATFLTALALIISLLKGE